MQHAVKISWSWSWSWIKWGRNKDSRKSRDWLACDIEGMCILGSVKVWRRACLMGLKICSKAGLTEAVWRRGRRVGKKGPKRSKSLVKLDTVGYSYPFELWGKQWAFVKRWADVLAYVYPCSHLLLCFEKTTVQQEKKRGVLQMLTQSSKQEKTVACKGVSATEVMRIWLWVCSASRNLKHLEDLDMRWTSKNGERGQLYASQRKLCWKWFGKAGVVSVPAPFPFFLSSPTLPLSFPFGTLPSICFLVYFLFSRRHSCKCQILLLEIIQTESNPSTCRT